jgi:hypothetical protein
MAKDKKRGDKKSTSPNTKRDEPVSPETTLPEDEEAPEEGSGISTDARNDRGWDGESTEYTPAPVEAPDDDTVDGDDGSGAAWTEAGVDGKRRPR